ncbi:hypothetical protein [Nonomuraea aurantiaca]|uniref:hypothetical protein n=1 Tax=Nonomuraea aurantiaca TaxID=2878562 RepID=UPI001CD9EB5D|nr:hypothetical protein [Nonomuraea aurantiaca]MCA2220806.1 hypothetical protein [Nonomuraea aurantiaca]
MGWPPGAGRGRRGAGRGRRLRAVVTGPGDDGYVEEAEPQWEKALRPIQNQALRDHLRFHCVGDADAVSSGALYLATTEWPPGSGAVEDLGATLIAGWSFGEYQHGAAVVRLP